ncbi:MAG: phosphomannomutase/phosphoglucomutase [Spirochaetes bacterium]|nr:MAG: phosphomannomutase/phosphoglucomutase [Spirochaetota bacterium]
MGIFKSYDIRGIYNKDWDREKAYRIGFFLPRLLNSKKIIVGRDIRLSSDEIFHTLSNGINDAGADVLDIGLCDTPACYFATAFYNITGSVMITASHNPKEYNGLKISREQAIPVGYETGLNKLEAMSAGEVKPLSSKGKTEKLDIKSDYLKHLNKFKNGIGEIKAVIDGSNGMVGIFIHDVVKGLSAEISFMYDNPDGNFPNHAPNPLIEANLKDLEAKVVETKADVGICFDGDADRVMFIDEKGKFISPDLITALIGLHFFKHYPEKPGKDKTVLYDVRSSRSVPEFISKLGGSPTICKVGHSHAKKLLRDTNGIYGGELAGHYYFRENYYCDSGMIAALTVLSILSIEKKPISELISSISHYYYSGEINFEVNDKKAVIDRIQKSYTYGELNTLDGIRIDFPEWWFNLRPSNTEPYLRLVVEANSPSELEKRVEELTEKIKA